MPVQHLKRSRRKWLILLQIALRKTRRVSCAADKPILFRKSIKRNFCWRMVCFEWFVFVFFHNFFVDRNQTWKLGRKPGLENMIEWDWRNLNPTRCEILCDRKGMYLSSKPCLPTLTNHACSQGKPNFYLLAIVLSEGISWPLHTQNIYPS